MQMVERASLARFTCREKSVRLLQDSIHSAETVSQMRDELAAADVKPLISLCHEWPWNQSPIHLRQDKCQPQDKAAILMNAKQLVEQYFVTPGNTNS